MNPRRSMSQIAREALERGGGSFHSLSNGPAVADVWINDRIGLVLMLHRRDDGLVAEELYHSFCDEKGQWLECEHLNGGIVGIDMESPEAITQALAGGFIKIVSESTVLIFTGCTDGEEAEEEEMEGLQPLRILNVLVGDKVDFLELEYFTRSSTLASGRRIREVKSPLNLIVLLPGEHVLVSPVEGDCASSSKLGPSWEIAN